MAFRESNAVHLEVLTQQPVVGVPIEVDVFDGANPGTLLDTLEGATDAMFQRVLNDIGSFKYRLSRKDPKATPDLVDREHLIKMKIGGVYRFSGWAEVRKITTLDAEAEEGGEWWEVEGRSGIAYIDRAAMANYSLVGDDPIAGVWDLSAAGTGNSIGAMFFRCLQERLAEPGSAIEFITTDWDYDVDSQANIWADTAKLKVNVGDSLLSIWRTCTALGMDSRMRHDLRLQAFVEMGRHFDVETGTGQVVLEAGKDFTATITKTRRTSEIKTREWVKGQTGTFFEATRPDLEADPYIRRREGFLQFGSSTDPTTLQRAAMADMASRALQIEGAVEVEVNHDRYQPFVHYEEGDWVTIHEPGVYDLKTFRIVAITCEQQEDDYKTTLSLNSIELEALLRLASKMLKREMGSSSASGSAVSGGGGAGTGATGNDYKVASATGDEAGFLYDKIEAGDGMVKSLEGAAGDQKVRLDALITMADIDDFDLTGLADDYIPVYHASTGLWGVEPKPTGGGGGGVPEDLGDYGDDFEGVALDAAWTLGGGATVDFPDDHTANLTFPAQKARITRDITAIAGTDFVTRALIRNMSDHGSSGGMTGIALMDGTGAGLVACFYAGTLYMMHLVNYAYSSTGLGGPGAPAAGQAYWLEVEKVGTTYRCRWTSDPAGLINWSAYSAGFVKATALTQVGLVRAYVNGGSITFRLDKFTII